MTQTKILAGTKEITREHTAVGENKRNKTS